MNDLLLCVNVVVKTWTLEIVIWQATSKNCTKPRAACAARLFFLIDLTQPIKLPITDDARKQWSDWLNKEK